jgi:plastocyanin
MRLRSSLISLATLPLFALAAAACDGDDGPGAPTADAAGADVAVASDAPAADGVAGVDAASAEVAQADAGGGLPLLGAIEPTPDLVRAATSRQFSLRLYGVVLDSGVTWRVDGVEGGGGTAGNITDTGLYSAPEGVPTQPITVRAEAPGEGAAAEHSFRIAKVTLALEPAAVTLAPGATQAFAATVQAQPDEAAVSEVTWWVDGAPGGSAGSGTVDASGTYTAPTTPPAAGTVTVEVRSKLFPSVRASATVTVL